MRRQQARWQIATRDREQAKRLAQATGLHPVAIDVLMQRGLTEVDQILRFLHPDLSHLHDPKRLPGMATAVERIQQAVALRQQICIYGDYDADGLTATALLVRFFRDLGLDPGYYIPRRLEEGYGLNAQAINEIAQGGAQLLITVDCGINSQAEVAEANRLGLDVVVTDHHTPDASRRPAAVAVLNPKLAEREYPFVELAGVGVALKLVQALGGLAAVARYLELVAIGTVADLVPLVDENRVLVHQGLLALKQPSYAGIAALLSVAGVEEGAVHEGSIAYQLAPRLNAAGRLNRAEHALELLLTDDPEQAAALATLLDGYNQERQSLEQQILLEVEQAAAALPPDQRDFILLAKSGWHHGVLGIVASRLVERYHRPVVLLAIEGDEARGSGRSIPGYNLVAGLKAAKHLLSAYGGHQAAAGLVVPEKNIAALRRELNAQVQSALTPEEMTPCLSLDGELDPSEVSLQLVQSLDSLGPFGYGHPQPIFCSRRWRLLDARLVGREGQHLKLRLDGGGLPWEVMAFRRAEEQEAIVASQWLDVAYTVQCNHWQGRTSVVLYLRDWQQPEAPDQVPVYDRRQELLQGLSVRQLLQQPRSVLTVFWPALAAHHWAGLWKELQVELPINQAGPIFLCQQDGQWRWVASDQVFPGDQLLWLDAPLGEGSLRALAQLLGQRLYRLGIHLLYNGNDIDRAYKVLETHGPSRQALAALFLTLRSQPREEWSWGQLAAALQSAGLLLLPDQVQMHLQVMAELALAECACSEQGASVRLLPPPAEKQDLLQSKAFREATEAMQELGQAKEWLQGPDAAGLISRRLAELVQRLHPGDGTPAGETLDK
jgi:single-stranded-DNA-specific exonuclease